MPDHHGLLRTLRSSRAKVEEFDASRWRSGYFLDRSRPLIHEKASLAKVTTTSARAIAPTRSTGSTSGSRAGSSRSLIVKHARSCDFVNDGLLMLLPQQCSHAVSAPRRTLPSRRQHRRTAPPLGTL